MDFLRDENGNIKSWVWIAGAGVVGVILLLMMGGKSSSAGGVVSTGTTGGQSSDITDQINQLNDAILALAGNSNIPQTTGTAPSPNPTNPQYLQDIIDQLREGNKVLEQAQQNMLSLLTQLSGYESQYSTAINQRSTINVQREGTIRQINDLKSLYRDKKISKATYDSRLKALTKTLDSQTAALKGINTTISNLEAAIKSIQDQITALSNPSP